MAPASSTTPSPASASSSFARRQRSCSSSSCSSRPTARCPACTCTRSRRSASTCSRARCSSGSACARSSPARARPSSSRPARGTSSPTAATRTARVRVEVEPALDMQQLLVTTAELAHEGNVLRSGMPKPLHLALFVERFKREVRAPFPPAWMVRVLMAPLAALARRRGHADRYTPAFALPLHTGVSTRCRSAPCVEPGSTGYEGAALRCGRAPDRWWSRSRCCSLAAPARTARATRHSSTAASRRAGATPAARASSCATGHAAHRARQRPRRPRTTPASATATSCCACASAPPRAPTAACTCASRSPAGRCSWIDCGHEVQINDTAADPRRTGSIYGFADLDAARRARSRRTRGRR